MRLFRVSLLGFLYYPSPLLQSQDSGWNQTVNANSYINVVILAFANAFAFISVPLVIFIASLVGAELAPSPGWATIPVASTVIGTAMGVWPVSRTTARFGRKLTSIVFLWLGVLACFIASKGIVSDKFFVFCFGTYLLGFTVAGVQQFRYAAIECLGKDRAPTAASIILAGGIFAAFVGPELAVIGKDLTAAEYQGSFWMAAICLVMASLVVLGFKPATVKRLEASTAARPLSQMINPGFCLAICSGAVGYFVMSFIMTATPISMHHHYMHSLVETKFVIQSHIAAMFLPSLISPLLFRWFGTFNMIKLGLLAYLLAIGVGYFYTSVAGFWVQLVFLGIGWSFLFVAGTAMLSNSYLPQDRLKAQAINDGLIFSLQAAASLGAGFVMARLSWAGLVSVGLIPVSLLLAAMIWYWIDNKKASLEAGKVI